MKLYKSNTKIKVSFCDLDPLNIVWHGNYLKYLELARGEMFESLGFGYEKMAETTVKIIPKGKYAKFVVKGDVQKAVAESFYCPGQY